MLRLLVRDCGASFQNRREMSIIRDASMPLSDTPIVIDDERIAAAEALAVRAQDDDPAVASEAAALLDTCAPDDHAVRSIALRAWGIAVRWTDSIDRSIELLRLAVDEATTSGKPDLVADARRSLAGSLALSGSSEQALATLAAPIRGARPLAAARVESQRATILARMGRVDEADRAYSRSLETFRAAGEPSFTALTLGNRGLLRLLAGRIRDAENDLVASLAIYVRQNYAFPAASIRHNLGHVALYRGQLAEALRIFSETEREIAGLRGDVYEMQVSHGEALMSAGLFDEAYDLGTRIADQMTAVGLDLDRAEALLLAAEAALALHDASRARAAADGAAALFSQQGRTTWAERAALIALQCDEVTPELERRTRARSLADLLERSGQANAGARARIEAVRLGLAIGDVAGASEDIAQLDRLRTHGPIELRLAAWHARALGQRARGRPDLAIRSLAAALRLAHRHQASLRASDLRAAVGVHKREIALLGCQILLERGDPAAFTDWIESYRAASLRLDPVEADPDSEQTELLAELRAVSKRLDDEPAEATTNLLRRRAHLVRRLRDSSRSFGHHQLLVNEPITAEQLVARLGDDPCEPITMVQYVEVEGQIAAVVLAPDRRQVLRLGEADPVRRAQRHLGRAIDDLAARRRVDRAVTTAQEASSELDERLVVPLGLADGPGPVVVVPHSAMFALPWSVLPSLRRHVVTIAPSASHWGRRRERPVDTERPSLLVSGPDLDEADAELAAIAAVGGETIILRNPDSTVARVLDALPLVSVAHLACHGAHRRGNALFSHLKLADGELTIFELDHVRSVPEVVVLSACESAATDDVGGAEMLGLTVAFLSLGTRSLVAGPGLVADAELTRELMAAFHRQLRNGQPVPKAWFDARQTIVTDDPALALLRDGSFNCYGN
jgi:tetratricopeptide (TPR) repeat protein